MVEPRVVVSVVGRSSRLGHPKFYKEQNNGVFNRDTGRNLLDMDTGPDIRAVHVLGTNRGRVDVLGQRSGV